MDGWDSRHLSIAERNRGGKLALFRYRSLGEDRRAEIWEDLKP